MQEDCCFQHNAKQNGGLGSLDETLFGTVQDGMAPLFQCQRAIFDDLPLTDNVAYDEVETSLQCCAALKCENPLR